MFFDLIRIDLNFYYRSYCEALTKKFIITYHLEIIFKSKTHKKIFSMCFAFKLFL